MKFFDYKTKFAPLMATLDQTAGFPNVKEGGDIGGKPSTIADNANTLNPLTDYDADKAPYGIPDQTLYNGYPYPDYTPLPQNFGSRAVSGAGFALKIFEGALDKEIYDVLSPVAQAVMSKKEQGHANMWSYTFEYGTAGSTRAMPEQGAIPKNFRKPNARGYLELANYSGSITFTDKMLRAYADPAINPDGAGSIFQKAMEDAAEDSARVIRRDAITGRQGIIARVKTAAAVGDKIVVLDQANKYMFSRAGDFVDFAAFDPAVTFGPDAYDIHSAENYVLGVTVNAAGDVVLNLAEGLSGAVAVGDVVVQSGSAGYSMLGIRDVFNQDASGNFGVYCGINRDTPQFSWMRPVISDFSGYAGFDIGMLDEVMKDLNLTSGIEKPSMIAVDPDTYNVIKQALNDRAGSWDLGQAKELNLPGLSYSGVQILKDPLIENRTGYFLNLEDWQCAQLGEWGIVTAEDSGKLKRISGTLEFEAATAWYGTLYCKKPWKQAKISFPATAATGATPITYHISDWEPTI
jgi:hypothetical protein